MVPTEHEYKTMYARSNPPGHQPPVDASGLRSFRGAHVAVVEVEWGAAGRGAARADKPGRSPTSRKTDTRWEWLRGPVVSTALTAAVAASAESANRVLVVLIFGAELKARRDRRQGAQQVVSWQ